jgi:hypothetical protein
VSFREVACGSLISSVPSIRLLVEGAASVAPGTRSLALRG